MLFVASMCVALPLTLLPQQLLVPLGLKTPTEAEKMALETGQFCARTLHQLIPFCSIETITDGCDNTKNHEYEPAVWVCNHTSMLDVFILLAADLRLRGPNKRPIKVVYVSLYLYTHVCRQVYIYITKQELTFVSFLTTTVETARGQSRLQIVVSAVWLYSYSNG